MSQKLQIVLQDFELRLQSSKLPPDDASIIIAALLKTDRSEIFAHPERDISPEEETSIDEAIAKRIAGYSVAVIIGHKEFYGLDFIVNEHTLIPRPETELLVETALAYLKKNDHQTILDMGTGSGCISIAIAKNATNKHSAFYGADISEKALMVARENARRHETPIHFFQSNLFENIPEQKYTLILANLPYLNTEQLQEPSIKREPVGALWGGSDGLDIYRAFLEQAQDHVAEHCCLLIEIDPQQASEIQKRAQESFPEADITFTKDLSGHDRLVSVIL